jgi:hypothetical protein
LLWGAGFPSLLIGALIVVGWWGALLFLVYPLQMLRRMASMPGPWRSRLQFACFEQLSRFPEAVGQFKFARDRLFGHRGGLIEYK